MSEQTQDGGPWWPRFTAEVGRKWLENRSTYPMETLAKYNGQYVAWIPDGSGIYDADPNRIALEERIRAAGDEPACYHIEYITDETYI
jgi:hypothetical protein